MKNKIHTIYFPKISELKTGHAITIEEFWSKCIKPVLPAKDIVVSWYKLLEKCVNDKDAVFAIRTYVSWTNKKHSFFYTDIFFAAYSAKKSID